MSNLYKFSFKNVDGKVWNELITEEELETDKLSEMSNDYEEDGFELVGQGQLYIGINDIDDLMLFEGDKVEFTNYKNKIKETGIIKFSKGSFYIDTGVLKIYNFKKLQDLKSLEV